MKDISDRVIIHPNLKPRPEQHELNAAHILAEHFNTVVEFVPRSNMPTADFLINGVIWELKSPTGSGKNNIQRQLQDAHHQSKNVIIDARRSKIHGARIRSQVEYQFKIVRSVRRLLYISKAGKVFEIKR